MSSPELPDVVITGLGVVSPIGVGRDAFWEALCDGANGVQSLSDVGHGLASRIGAAVDSFEPKAYVRPRKSLKVMSREIQLAMAAAGLAWDDSGIDDANLATERLGVVGGCDMLYGAIPELEPVFRACIDDGQFEFERWGQIGIRELSPLWMLKYLPNMAACHIGISRDARGPCNTIVQGEASSLLSVIEGTRLIRRGVCDVVIVGGTSGRLHPTSQVWRNSSILSQRNDSPAAASRPFDAARDGMVNGEGAAMLVLESHPHAIRRGAEIYATIRGYGETWGRRGPRLGVSQAATERSIQAAMTMSGWNPREIGHVSAHGLSTKEDDEIEAAAIRETLADVPVTAAKGNIGNLGAAGGTLELIGCVLAAHHGLVPPTRNYETPDPKCPIQVVATEPMRTDRRRAIKLNQSRTGQAVAVAIEA